MPCCNNGCATSKSFARDRRGVALRCAASPLAERRGVAARGATARGAEAPRGVVGAEDERCAERVTAGASLLRMGSVLVFTLALEAPLVPPDLRLQVLAAPASLPEEVLHTLMRRGRVSVIVVADARSIGAAWPAVAARTFAGALSAARSASVS